MPDLPHLSGREIIRALERMGFEAVRRSGSHVVMRSGGRGGVVPLHKTVKVGTPAGLLRQPQLDVREFLDLLSTGSEPDPGSLYTHADELTGLLFISLQKKSAALFSPFTRQRDLALGPSLFHGHSQGSITEPFVCLGFARYESCHGGQPMAWASLRGGWSGRFRRRGCR